MKGRNFSLKMGLQIVVFVVASLLATEFAPRPSWSFSFVLTLLVASYRPIWKHGHVIDRIFQFTFGAVLGLAIWFFVGWLADQLFISGIFDAGSAATVAGYKGVLGSLAAYLATVCDMGRIIGWFIQKNAPSRPSPTSIILSIVLAPYLGATVATLVYEGLSLRSEVVPVAIMVVSVIAYVPYLARGVHWTLDRRLFGLEGSTAEGSRRLGLLAGWAVGAPISILILGVVSDGIYDKEIVLLAPLVGIVGWLLAYVAVHAVFWTLDGFKKGRAQ